MIGVYERYLSNSQILLSDLPSSLGLFGRFDPRDRCRELLGRPSSKLKRLDQFIGIRGR